MDTERDVGVGRDLPPFGMLLRRYRRQADLTQEGLAARAHVSLRGLSDLERGVNHAPRPDTARLLADALGLMGRERAAFEAAARRHGSPVEAAAPPFGAMRPGRIAPVLVAREHELALLQRHLDGVGPPVLLLAGEPGMGKSRLLREAALSAGLAGWRVLAGGCQRRGGQEPFAPLMEALTRHIRGQTPRQLRAQLQGCAWLIRLLPELRAGPVEPLPAWTVSPEHERRLMFDAVGRLLANLAGPAGTLLALDDLQWAGQDALDLLAALVRAPLPVPLRVVGAYRDTEVRPDAPLGALLGDLAQAGLACQRTLAPLDAVAAAQLLDQLLAGMEGEAGPLRERVIARAGGVPFFLVSYAQALRDGVLDRGHGALGVPWDLAQGVRQRVAALPPIARDVLGVAAVVGRVAPRALLVAVAGRPVGEVLDALEATRQAHLLEEVGPAAYRFAHDVIREVVEADLGAGRRSLTHARVAEALEQGARAPDAEVVAYHYAQTDARARAAAWLERAGDQAAARHANAAALAHYTAARTRLADGERDGEILDGEILTTALSRLDEKLGDLHTRVSAHAEAEADYARARAQVHDPGRRADLRRKEAFTWIQRWEFARALVVLELAAAEGAEAALPPLVRAAIDLHRADAHLLQANWFNRPDEADRAEVVVARALAMLLAQRPDEDTRLALTEAYRFRGEVAAFRGAVDAAAADYERSLRQYPEHSLHGRLPWTWYSLGMVALKRGDLGATEAHLRQGLALLERLDEPVSCAVLLRDLGLLRLRQGDLQGAEYWFGRIVRLMERTGKEDLYPEVWWALGRVAGARGRLDEAEAFYRRGLTIAERVGQEGIRASWLTRMVVALGAVLLERGDLPGAARWYRAARRHAGRGTIHPQEEAAALLGRGQVCLQRGQWRRASLLLARAQALLARASGIGSIDADRCGVEAALMAAELHLSRAQMAAACAAAEEAVRHAAMGHWRREERRARCVEGQCLARSGRLAEAIPVLREALAAQGAMGTALDAARTRVALAEALVDRSDGASIPAEAQTLLAEARTQFLCSGATGDLAHLESVLAEWGHPDVDRAHRYIAYPDGKMAR